MDSLTKYSAELEVSPFGEAFWVQDGVRIKGPSLKSRFTHALADESVYDMTPEECVPLKKRMVKRGY